MDCERCGKYLKSNQINNVRRHYDSNSCKTKTAAAAKNLQALQPPEKRQRLLVHERYDYCFSKERSTCNDSVASVEHNQPKPFCCGYMPDVPSHQVEE